MPTKPKIVCIGGGSGLSTLLSGLKQYPVHLTAVVAMSDNGHSSGRVRKVFDTLPPGDIRKCLLALSPEEELLGQLFKYRFQTGRGLSGHSLGNLLLVALENISGGFGLAVQGAGRILAISGRIVPVTLEKTHLGGVLASGQRVVGEVELSRAGHRSPIERIFLEPEAEANPAALEAIKEADILIIGPGSLFSSILANFLIKGIKEAVAASKARKVYICNVSTERGETERYTVANHVAELIRYGGGRVCDEVVVNKRVLKANGEEGKLGHIRNITTAEKLISGKPVRLADVVDDTQPLYHHKTKLAAYLMKLLKI